MRALLLTSQFELKKSSFKPNTHIHYDYNANKLKLLSDLDKLSSLKVDTILLTGTHGNYAGTAHLNGIPEPDVVRFVDKLQQKNQGVVKNAVFDCCDSAYFIPHFKKLFDDEGVIYCNLSDGRQHHALHILNNYQTYQNLTLGIALFNIVSTMVKFDAMVKDNMEDEYVLTYPAVYQKKNNTLYYYGHADQNIIDNLTKKNITVVKMTVLNNYLDKLIESKTPIKEDIDKVASDIDLSDWHDLSHQLMRIEDKPSTMNDIVVKTKLLGLFAQHFKNKEKIRVEEYTKILFPLAQRLTKEGSNPIRILAMAACQYRLGHENTEDVDIFSEAISQVLQAEFATHLLQNELDKALAKTPQPSVTQWQDIEAHLRKYGKVVLGENLHQELEPILQKIVPPNIAESPAKKLDVTPKKSPPKQSPMPDGAKSIKMNWFKALLHAAIVSIAVTACLFCAPWLGISLSVHVIGVVAIALGCLSVFKDILVCNAKPTQLKEFTQNVSALSEDKLKSFLVGTLDTHTSTITNSFNYRTWLYMQDYYAGQAAKEMHQGELITTVEKRLCDLRSKK